MFVQTATAMSTQERKQFKQRIADFQATQFKLADMAGKIVSSRLMLRYSTLGDSIFVGLFIIYLWIYWSF